MKPIYNTNKLSLRTLESHFINLIPLLLTSTLILFTFFIQTSFHNQPSHHFSTRHYNMERARFIGEDPAAIDPFHPITLNKFVYANNNPVRYVDPDGRAAEPFWLSLAMFDGPLPGPMDILAGTGYLAHNTALWLAKPGNAALTLDVGSYAIDQASAAFGKTQMYFETLKYNFPESSMRHAFAKHGYQFGNFGNWDRKTMLEFKSAIFSHMFDKNTQMIQGTFRTNIDAIHFFNPETNLNVMFSSNSNFLGGWELDPRQADNLLQKGNIQ